MKLKPLLLQWLSKESMFDKDYNPLEESEVLEKHISEMSNMMPTLINSYPRSAVNPKHLNNPLSGDFFDADNDANDSDVGGTQSNKKSKESLNLKCHGSLKKKKRDAPETKNVRNYTESSPYIYAQDFKAIKEWIQN